MKLHEISLPSPQCFSWEEKKKENRTILVKYSKYYTIIQSMFYYTYSKYTCVIINSFFFIATTYTETAFHQKIDIHKKGFRYEREVERKIKSLVKIHFTGLEIFLTLNFRFANLKEARKRNHISISLALRMFFLSNNCTNILVHWGMFRSSFSHFCFVCYYIKWGRAEVRSLNG